ncbi:MAG: hypothetical protein RLZZ370_146 [Bacteroidota bacterium]|jgi:ArsR family transcriptional regulator
MARRKAEQFDSPDLELGSLAKALGHPARIKIVKMLLASGSLNCKDIVSNMPLSQSTVSQHLAELKQAGIIEGRGFRTSMIYSVNKDVLKSMHSVMGELFFPKSKPVQATLF